MRRHPKYCTKYYGAAAHDNPAAQSAIAHGRLHKTLPKHKRKLFRATLTVCPPFRLVTNVNSCSETTCRAVAARGFSISCSPQFNCCVRSNAYPAARLFVDGGPLSQERIVSSASAIGVRSFFRHSELHTVHTHTGTRKRSLQELGRPLTFNGGASH